MSLRFEHTRPDGDKVIVIFYNAVSESKLDLSFKKDSITLFDLTFEALADSTRAEGDQLGVICEQSA